MKKNSILFAFCIASTALFHQINAQISLNRQSFGETPQQTAPLELELLDSIVYIESYEGIIYNGNKQAWEYAADGEKSYFSWYYWNTATEAWTGIQRLDSIFDDKGQLSMILKDSWNSETGQWRPGNKMEWEYNDDGDLILYTLYSWNNETGEWKWNSKTESTHFYKEDNSHSLISINYNYNHESGEWMLHHRNEQHYDANGNMTLYNSSWPDTATNAWVFNTGSFLYEYSFDENGNQILSSYYVWDNTSNDWKGQGNLIETTFDSNENITTQVIKKWDVSFNQWANDSKSEFSYNEEGKISGMIESEWDNADSLWLNSSKQEYIYDTYQNLFQFVVFQVDTTSSNWYPVSKNEFSYDLNNKEILMEYYELNKDGELVILNKEESVYDTFGNVVLKTVYSLDAESGEFIKSDDSRYSYNETGDKLIEEAISYYYDGIPFVLKTAYYYSIHVVNSIRTAKDFESKSPLVYPNPFSSQVSFLLNNNRYNLELFDAQGRKVLSTCVQNSETIDLTNLAPGVYFYNLSQDDNIHRGKLIKE